MRNALASGSTLGLHYRHSEQRTRPVMEVVEPRRMMSTVVVTSNDAISDLTGAYGAAVMFGDDGFEYGCPTATAGNGGQMATWSYTTWDSNLDDGVDSGYTAFQFAVNADDDGLATLAAGGSETTTFSAGSSIGLHEVTIQAGVMAPSMKMEWRNLTISFYRGGQLVETVNVGGLTADTMDSTTYDPVGSIARVTASASDYDGVLVKGDVRLVAAEGTYPSPTDIFGQVVIS